MKTQTLIPSVSARLKRSSNPYNHKGETVYIYKDHANGRVEVDYSPQFEKPFDVLREDLSPVRKQVKPINHFSELRGKENKVYLTLRKVFLDNHPLCEAGLPGCTKQATTIHHSIGRIGNRLIDIKTFVPLCGGCHTWVENNADQAKELGLSLNRL